MSELINRAPDNQPTENLRNMLSYARRDLAEWERSQKSLESSLVKHYDIVDRRRAEVQRLEDQLAIRLQEEQEAVEVNGL